MRFVSLLEFDWRLFCACKKWVAWSFRWSVDRLWCLCAKAFRKGVTLIYRIVHGAETQDRRRIDRFDLENTIVSSLIVNGSTMIARDPPASSPYNKCWLRRIRSLKSLCLRLKAYQFTKYGNFLVQFDIMCNFKKD